MYYEDDTMMDINKNINNLTNCFVRKIIDKFTYVFFINKILY